MRVRVIPDEARARLAADLERAGGRVWAAGETLVLSYPGDELHDLEQERLELTFFLRAWTAADPDVQTVVMS